MSEDRVYGKFATAAHLVMSAAKDEADAIRQDLQGPYSDEIPHESICVYEGAYSTAAHVMDLQGKTPEDISCADMREIKRRNRVEDTWPDSGRMVALVGCFFAVLYAEEVNRLVGGNRVEEYDLLDFEPHFE